MKKIYTILVCLCMLASFVACEKDKEFVLTTLSVTGEVLAPTYEAATIQCKLSADATISEAYVHYSLTSSFEDYKEVKMELVHENYSALLLNLADNTTYYIRYKVSNKYSQVMSKSVNSFTTLAGTENGYGYVDLGLSVKWATCNVGANSPEEYGDYFAWGETEPKSTYDWSTYKWCNGSYDSLTKYCTNSNYGRVDNKTTLELSDDAAYVNWGGSWRMPTDAELTELREQCTWTWTTQNGVDGYKVTSKSNGNSIFLPAAGYRSARSLTDAGSRGYYWSSSLDTVDPYAAWCVGFYSSYVYRNFSNHFCGNSVRPVCP